MYNREQVIREEGSEDFSMDGTSDPTPADRAVFEELVCSPSGLTAQMTDDTSRAPRLYTPK